MNFKMRFADMCDVYIKNTTDMQLAMIVFRLGE